MLLVGAVLYVAVYLILVFFRIQYPFELEWMEGGSLEQVRRILSSQKLYVSPSLEFIPYIYTPFYFYLSAIVSKITGIGFMPLRLVSFVSSMGCFLIIFLIVNQETKSTFSSILASCLFAATFQKSGAFFDIARADSLFLFFLLAAIYLVRFKISPTSYVLAGVLVSLSFLTKQTALIISLPIMFYCVYSNRRCSIFFIATIVIITGISTILLNHIHDGWYNYYIFDLPMQHSIAKRMLLNFWVKDLMLPLPIACIMSLFYILRPACKFKQKELFFYLLIAAGMLGASWISRLNRGGYLNALFPAYAIISILFGLATHTVFQSVQAAPAGKRKLMEIFVYLVCIIQFSLLFYNPFDQIPTRDDIKAGTELVDTIKQMKGDVLVPQHGYLSVLAGKHSYAHWVAILEVVGGLGGEPKEEGKKLENEIAQAIREKRFSAIIQDMDCFKDIERYYTIQRPVFSDETIFWTVTGARTRPQVIYVPKH
jgi:4-amino-4-deoxy-L-arabinose transferase-like glycosyltransferase